MKEDIVIVVVGDLLIEGVGDFDGKGYVGKVVDFICLDK